MNKGLVTVFGGSGFLGKHVVRALVAKGYRVRVAMRRPHTGMDLKVIGGVGQVQLMQANLRYEKSVARAVEGADAVINLAAILYEEGQQTFEGVHVRGAETIAKAVAAHKVTNFVHVSAIGADENADSEYSRTKGEAETLIRNLVPTVDIMRPSILFGVEDSFFNRFATMAQYVPVLPLIGGGDTKFQPVYVGDVAQAIATKIAQSSDGKTYELGGPRTYSFKELLQYMLEVIAKKRILAPIPWFGAGLFGLVGELSGLVPFMKPFLTRDQVKSLKTDNVVSDNALGLSDLGITPETVEAIVPTYLVKYRKYGEFHQPGKDSWPEETGA
ncbi:NADH dehydrogenase [Litorimonas taeanensis]|uniref:NADH dehydrogenase n=1 Tax=Litorimonas taeanensis TaxID=568099 RepID=A0A420WEH1_9PROT|nr:complex I NDUFA9 subunit family protein [Litorimonas taeanensis]RKQ69292.1 NADH dehydrogenase [Litorimonas taeanensis]